MWLKLKIGNYIEHCKMVFFSSCERDLFMCVRQNMPHNNQPIEQHLNRFILLHIKLNGRATRIYIFYMQCAKIYSKRIAKRLVSLALAIKVDQCVVLDYLLTTLFRPIENLLRRTVSCSSVLHFFFLFLLFDERVRVMQLSAN